MANAYIKADRVAGNAFTDRFHSHAKQLEATVKRLNDDVTQRMQSDLSQGTRLATASAVLIVGVFVVGALAISAGLVRRVQALLRALQDIAEGEGDLTKRLDVSSADEIGELARWFNVFMEKLHGIIGQVKGTAIHVTAASGRLSSAGDQLSAGAQQQASSLEETAASLEEITGTVKQNADNARQASQLANAARDTADRGRQVVTAAVMAMGEINGAASQISDIINVIDDIAF